MERLVVAEVFIDGTRVEPFADIFLKQRFNQHHEFSVSFKHDVLESLGSFKLENSKELIGKTILISFIQTVGVTSEAAYDFLGRISEIGMVKSDRDEGTILIRGYSDTILLEDGPRLASYNENSIKDIAEKTVKAAITKEPIALLVGPDVSTDPVKYVCQYKESSFHFLNRLSLDYGQIFYYDGGSVIFGQPEKIKSVEVVYGEDMNEMQLGLHVEPLRALKYGYSSKKDELIFSGGDGEIGGLFGFASHVVKVSDQLYSEDDESPLMQSVQNQLEADMYVQKGKEAIAAGLVVLTGTTDNPKICLACVAAIKISKRNGDVFVKEDFEDFFVIGITHHITANGKYYNTFEGLSNWVRGIPVYNAAMPMADPQMAIVIDNKDPDKLSRVRVRMQWQNTDEQTDWIWVMVPDAGSGKDGASGGGFVFIPEIGDRVLVGFFYNNPDRPFVMGSMFHGKSAGAGSSRCITGRKSSAKVCIDDAAGSVNIIDGGANTITLDGKGNIKIDCSETISITCGSSSIKMDKAGKVFIGGKEITIHGVTSAEMKSTASFKAKGSTATVDGFDVKITGGDLILIGDSTAKLKSGEIEINARGTTEVKGSLVKINP